MATQSEDVLLSVSNVRHKKADGTLYVMGERVVFMPNGKDKITLSVKYSEIKTQKISPEGKPKTQLQLALHSGEAPTFHFVNLAGPTAQKGDRDAVKELLQQLLPKFKEKMSKDMIEKKRILHENPDLYQLYKDLVASQIISAEEFWTNVAASRLSPGFTEGDVIDLSDILFNSNSQKGPQPVGINPAFLCGIKPQTDGCNGIKYNINNEVIEAIFRTYPAVKKKHFEYVPSKLTEAEFWTRFFQSHYFHKDRVFAGPSASTSSSKSDFFVDCARLDDQTMKETARLGVDDPFVNITAFSDHYVDPITAATGVNSDDLIPNSESNQQHKSNKNKDREESTSTFITPNQALIKRFNHHSIMVLDTCLRSSQSDSSSSSKESQKVSKEVEGPTAKKQKLQEKTSLEDLSSTSTEGDPFDWTFIGSRPLRITDKERYMVGPQAAGGDLGRVASIGSFTQAVHGEKDLIESWRPDLPICVTPVSALAALNELRPGGSLMTVSSAVDLKVSVPADVQKELRNIYTAGNELLRHFWSCFPVTSERLEQKLHQMKVTLEKFQFSKLQPFHEKLQKEHYNSELTNHLNHQIVRAFERFSRWQTNKSRLARKVTNST